MKKPAISIVGCLCLLGLATGARAEESLDSLDDVILLVEAGISDETIRVFITSRQIEIELGPEEILRLRRSGVSEAVLEFLLTRIGAARPEPADSRVPLSTGPFFPSRYYRGNSVFSVGYYLGASYIPRWWFYHLYFSFPFSHQQEVLTGHHGSTHARHSGPLHLGAQVEGHDSFGGHELDHGLGDGHSMNAFGHYNHGYGGHLGSGAVGHGAGHLSSHGNGHW